MTEVNNDKQSDGKDQDGRWHKFRERFATARAISIITSLGTAAGVVWLLGYRHDYGPPAGTAEWFWVRAFTGFIVVTLLQIWTLVTVTGRGDDLEAAVDKFVALSPAIAVALCEVYWIGADNVTHLSWRHHYVGIAWAMFSVTDFFSTDIINQRLRTRQIGLGPQSV